MHHRQCTYKGLWWRHRCHLASRCYRGAVKACLLLHSLHDPPGAVQAADARARADAATQVAAAARRDHKACATERAQCEDQLRKSS